MYQVYQVGNRTFGFAAGILAASALLVWQPSPAIAQEALVINGEEIASAELLAQAREEGTLTLYTGYFEDQERAITDEFTNDTGVRVNLLTLSGGTLFERILTEHGAGRLGADVIRLTDPTYQTTMQAEGILEPYEFPNWEEIPETLRGPDGYYWGSMLSLIVFGYNTEIVAENEIPQSWADLLDPRWAGQKIATWDINAGGSPWGIALIQRQQWGIEYWEGLAQQDVRFFPRGAPAAEEVARGELPITVNSFEPLLITIASGAPVKLSFPTDGVVVIPHYLAVAADSQNPAAAKLFTNWSASKRGAEVAASHGSYTSNPDAPSVMLEGEALPRPSEMTLLVPDAEDYINLRAEWVEEWRRVFNRQ